MNKFFTVVLQLLYTHLQRHKRYISLRAKLKCYIIVNTFFNNTERATNFNLMRSMHIFTISFLNKLIL